VTFREFVKAAGAALAIFAVMALVKVALAPAATVPASPEGTAFVQQTAAWVEKATGAPVQRRTAFFVESFDYPGLEHAGAIVTGPGGERIEFRSNCEHALTVLGMRRGRPFSAYCARVALHETLHTWDTGSAFPEWARWIEHGLVEAVAEDLWPAWVFQTTGRRGVQSPFTVHTDAVAHARRASGLATGRPWTSREARVWRRNVWAMDEIERDAAFRAVGMLCSTCREEPEPEPELLPPAPDAPPAS